MYIDIRAIPAGLRIRKEEGKHNIFAENSSAMEEVSGITSFLDLPRLEYSQSFNQCDLYAGSWVWDESYPLYQSPNFPFIDPRFRCQENGRPDKFYMKWWIQVKEVSSVVFFLCQPFDLS